jgi:hypothetical protein
MKTNLNKNEIWLVLIAFKTGQTEKIRFFFTSRFDLKAIANDNFENYGEKDDKVNHP